LELVPENAISDTRVLQKLTSKSQKAFSTNRLQAEKRVFRYSRYDVYLYLHFKSRFLPLAHCRKTRFPPNADYLKLNFKPGKAFSAISLRPETAFPQLALPLIFDFRQEKMICVFC